MTSSYKRVYSFCETPPGVIKEVDCGLGTASTVGEYSYFHSQIITADNFAMNFPAVAFQVLDPNLPSNFLMFNLATSSSGSTISSSGANLQFINTVAAGRYKFTVHFTILNTSSSVLDPETTITLGTPAAAPYVNPVTGFFEVTSQLEPHNRVGPNAYIVSMAGVVDLPANTTTALNIVSIQGATFDFGTFDVIVERMPN